MAWRAPDGVLSMALGTALVLLCASAVAAQETTGVAGAVTSVPALDDAQAVAPRPAASEPAPLPQTVACSSRAGERHHCPADTSAGVALARSHGEAACLLGKTWGYDDMGIWVLDGCGADFIVGRAEPGGGAQPAAAPPVEATPLPSPRPTKEPTDEIESWGEFEPGKGFLVGRGSAGELSISAYALVRYLNQTPGEGRWTISCCRSTPA